MSQCTYMYEAARKHMIFAKSHDTAHIIAPQPVYMADIGTRACILVIYEKIANELHSV